MSLIELTRRVRSVDELLAEDGFWLLVEPLAELPVAELLPAAEPPLIELLELDSPFSTQWPFTSTLWPSCFSRFLPSNMMLLSAPVVPAVALLELPMLDDELDEPIDTLVSMYFAAVLLELLLGLLPVVPVVAL